MANKFLSDVTAVAGLVDYSIQVQTLRNTTDNLHTTGKGPGDVTASYWRQGGVRTAITPTSLGSVNAAHSDGGFIEVDATNQPGVYRFDVPDAVFASGADWVTITVKISGVHIWNKSFTITEDVRQTGDNFAALATAQADLDDIQTRLPAALSSGRMVSEAQAISNGIITESTITGGFLDAVTADVLGETIAELAQAQPSATPTLRNLLMFLYMAFRNGGVSSTTLLEVKNDAGVVIAKANLAELANVFTKDKFVAGP